MNSKTISIIVIILLVIAIIVGVSVSKDSSDETMAEKDSEAMMSDQGGMMNGGDSATNGEDGGMMDKEDAMMDGDESMMKKGSYETYSTDKLALANSGNVVLFFRAKWCPTCRALDADIRANMNKIPGDLTILDVDYDDSTALKQKYGVTYQHTLVQVDANGNQIAKWSSSPTLSALVSQVK